MDVLESPPRLEEEAPPTQAEAVPAFSSPVPRGLWGAVRRHWILALLPVIALTAAGVAYGLRHQPTYTASAKLAISKLDLTAPGALAGFTDASEALAQTFSRSINATGVVDPVASSLGIAPAAVQARLSAVPVAQTPVFEVQATGPSQSSAVRLANAGSTALIAYLTRVNSTVPQARLLLAQYRRQALAIERLQTARAAAKTAYTLHPDATTLLVVQQASASLQAAQLHLQTLFLAYQNAVENNPAPGLVQVLTPAASATSDRQSKLALYGLAGLLAGLVVGLALASARGAVRRRPR